MIGLIGVIGLVLFEWYVCIQGVLIVDICIRCMVLGIGSYFLLEVFFCWEWGYGWVSGNLGDGGIFFSFCVWGWEVHTREGSPDGGDPSIMGIIRLGVSPLVGAW